ncbi:KpsF/GutQ family protein [Alphaproteobacteria bacterium]|nr:KpsF/GutQ family protein [Alphaproteobacteria bacterium]
MTDFLNEAKRVIKEEAAALRLLAENLPSGFENAADIIFSLTGRLVVSGIGKSGHIGRKISSTMASLGQKSFFMHPSEAHHGDLGMLAPDDALLLISHSGEAVELLPVIDFAKRIGIKIISISKTETSSLAKNSDIALCLPEAKEACPLGVAPTVSSTMTLALGDALAVALLSKRGFTREQFKLLHPGGQLGRSLAFVFDIMHTKIPLIMSGSLMQDALIEMTSCGFGCIGVVNNFNKFIGIITDGDLRRNMSRDLLSKSVDEIMTKNPRYIDKNMLVSELLLMMENEKITNIFVVNNEREPIGVVHIHDMLMRKIV